MAVEGKMGVKRRMMSIRRRKVWGGGNVTLLFLSAYRKWLLCLFVILLGDIQAVYEALQLFPEGFHLCVDTIQQLVLSDPEEEQVWTFKIR